MTAKDKAIELVGRFLNIVPCNDNELSEDDMHKEQLHIAKQCALICVDEMINTGVNQDYIKQDGYMLSLVEFYTEVKQEINKL